MALLSLMVFLSGCSEELYSGLAEDEANEMLATLIRNDIPADKANQGKGNFSVYVDRSSMEHAIGILKDAGFPRKSRDSLGKVFEKSGIVSSPFEERVRYIYALGQEVATTLNQIDGVLTARVHVVLPKEPQPGQDINPSSAAVFIRYKPGVDLEFFIPDIRSLVASAIEGLEYSAVTVVLKEAVPSRLVPERQKYFRFLGLSIRAGETARLWRLVGIVVFVFVLVLGGSGAVLYWRFYANRSGSQDDYQIEPTSLQEPKQTEQS